jgi:uncharacterized membrane protein
MKVLRVLAVVVTLGFIVLLLVGFDNILALLRSRVALFLVLSPLVGLFLWSVYMAFKPRKRPPRYIDIDVPPAK